MFNYNQYLICFISHHEMLKTKANLWSFGRKLFNEEIYCVLTLKPILI